MTEKSPAEERIKEEENKLLQECGKPITDYLQGFEDGKKQGIELGKKEVYKKIFDIFGEFSCIQNDKWFLDLKKDILGEKK